MNPFGDLLKIYAERNPQGGSIYYGTDKKETWKELPRNPEGKMLKREIISKYWEEKGIKRRG